MRHTSPEMSKALLSLLGKSEVSLRYQDMTHRKHTKSSQLLRRIEHHRREATGHFGIEAYLDPSLNLIFGLHQQIQHFFSMNDSLPEVSHEPNKSSVPFVGYFGESSRATCHQDLPHSILKSLQRVSIDSDEGMSSDFLGDFILKLPNPLSLRKLFLQRPYLGQQPDVKPSH